MTPYLIGAAIGAVVGAIAVVLWLVLAKQDARRQANSIIEEGRRSAADLTKDAELKIREKELAAKSKLDQETAETKDKLRDLERELDRRQASLDQKIEGLRKQERIVEGNQRKLTDKLERITQREQELEKVLDQQRQMLHQVSGLDKAEATGRLMKLLEDELKSEAGAMILKSERQAKEVAEEKSREILITAMQRFAAAHTAESTTSTVDIPNDDMKGRIIGREGRNIRAFEKETGVDVIIDDTPGVVIVSGFDPVRREVARQSLVKLIADGRIHPVRIEEVVKETQSDLEEFIIRKGKEAALEADVPGLHERLIYLLGRLHFRTSYSQNVLRHSIEVSFLTGMMAEMVGLDGNLGRRCGLLHDLGKAADHELEGGHPKIGADLLKRHGENAAVVHAALGHHDDIVIEQPYTMLVATADACSAGRPGARRESLERYVKRMEELESIALEFQGVQQAFAIQAGREVRVLVSSDDVDDRIAAKVCRDIASAYEERLAYPGEIKVTVIRESRFMELAR